MSHVKMTRKEGRWNIELDGVELRTVKGGCLDLGEPGDAPILVLETMPGVVEVDADGVKVERATICPKCEERTEAELWESIAPDEDGIRKQAAREFADRVMRNWELLKGGPK
jgi:hypothetical protein